MPEGEHPIPKPSIGQRLKELLQKKGLKKTDEPAIPEGVTVDRPKPKQKPVASDDKTMEEKVEFDQIKQQVLDRLNDRDKQIYEMIYVQGMKATEVAKVLGVSDSYIGQRKFFIEAQMRRAFR